MPTQITEDLAGRILTRFLTSTASAPELATEFDVPLFALLRWFDSEEVQSAVAQITALHRTQQALAASIASPRAIASLLKVCESDTGKVAVAAAASILRFAASATRTSRTKPESPASAHHRPPTRSSHPLPPIPQAPISRQQDSEPAADQSPQPTAPFQHGDTHPLLSSS